MQPIRLLLLDDHILFRESLSRLLASEPDFEMVGQSGTSPEALDMLSRKPVDVVLLDFDLGEEHGSQFIAAARRATQGGGALLHALAAPSRCAFGRCRAGAEPGRVQPGQDAARRRADRRVCVCARRATFVEQAELHARPGVGRVEQPDEQRLAPFVDAGDLGAELAGARRQLVGGEVDLADARIYEETRSRRKR